MIAACPKCSARYRVDEAKIGAEGVRLRCAKCEAVFRVRAPGGAAPQPAAPAPVAPQAPAAPPAAPTAQPAESAAQPAASAAQAPTPPAEGAQSYDSARLVVVADPEVERGRATAAAIESWGLQAALVQDGVEAMLTIQRTLPKAVVLDAALPKMYGFQICEVIKRNESLRDTTVVLVGAINDQDRYRRPPTDLYGADAYLEQPDLPGGLASILGGGTPAQTPPPSAPEAAAAAPPAPAAQAVPAASAPAEPAPAAGGSVSEDEQAQAERLARIVVSDIILYHPERFEAAVLAGNVLEALDQGIEEGQSLFRQRIPDHVRAEKDYIVEELMRVARERGMT